MPTVLDHIGVQCREFGTFRLIPDERLLLREGEPVSLPPKVFDALVLLVENEGHLIGKNDLLDRLWPDSFVEEATLARTISSLRKALGENGGTKYIETVPKRGYRFVAPVQNVFEHKPAIRQLVPEHPIPPNAAAETDLPEPAPDTLFGKILSRPTIIAVSLIGALISIALMISWNQQALPTNEVRSIAVLPFHQLGEGERDETLEFGMADTLIARLSNLKRIIVRPTSAVSKYVGAKPEAVAVGRDLKVDAVVEGSIQKSGERIRVTVQLISTADGAPLWADKFDANFTDIFSVQDSISEQVVRALALQLTGEERQLVTKRPTENTEAYRLYITGRYFWNKRSTENLRKSIGYYEQAIAHDPKYALAYTGLADCYQLMAEYHAGRPDQGFPKAKEYALKALEIDPDLSEAHTSLAYTLAFYDWDWPGAERAFKRAIELDPNYATAHQWYGEYLIAMGRFEEARAEHDKALELNPTSLIFHMELASVFYVTRQFDESIAMSKRVIEMEPSFPFSYAYLSFAYNQKGMKAEAAAAYIDCIRFFGEVEEANELKETLAREGVQAMWLRRIEQVDRPEKKKTFPAQWRALLHIWAGQKKEALDWLDIAFERRDRWMVNARYSPEMDPLRSEPRFQELLVRIGL